MTHLTGSTGANGQVAQILENQSCTQKSMLPRTWGDCGGRSKDRDIIFCVVMQICKYYEEIGDRAAHRREWIVRFNAARRLFTFSWGLTWRNVNCGLGRRKTFPSLKLIQKPERRSQRFRK